MEKTSYQVIEILLYELLLEFTYENAEKNLHFYRRYVINIGHGLNLNRASV